MPMNLGPSGTEFLTNVGVIATLPAVADPDKRRSLLAQGNLYGGAEQVTAELFQTHPEFFDREDKLQVRYELLRATTGGDMTVTEACRAFGVSRQTFYTLQRSFQGRGVAGLADAKRGRKGPLKASLDVVAFVREARAGDPSLSGADLAAMVAERFGIHLHRRTVERLLQTKKKRQEGADG
jgi:transposase